MLLERPWGRVKDPVAIPHLLDTDSLLELTDQDLAILLRDHLVPRPDLGNRRSWERLWTVLGGDPQLSDRAFDVLEDLLDTTEAALQGEQLDDHQRRRAEKFLRFCEDAWKRLQLDDDKPLGWAGRAAVGFNPPARRVLERLVDAIAHHRTMVTREGSVRETDEQLWRVLGAVGLDPAESRRRRR